MSKSRKLHQLITEQETNLARRQRSCAGDAELQIEAEGEGDGDVEDVVGASVLLRFRDFPTHFKSLRSEIWGREQDLIYGGDFTYIARVSVATKVGASRRETEICRSGVPATGVTVRELQRKRDHREVGSCSVGIVMRGKNSDPCSGNKNHSFGVQPK